MKVIRSIWQGMLAFISRSNPEKLWMHYSIALLIIFGLLFTTHQVNHTIIDRSAAASGVIKTSNSQVVLGQEILMLAEASLLDARHFSTLRQTVEQFGQAHSQVTTKEVWSDELQRHYFSDPVNLDKAVRTFADLAGQLHGASPSGQLMVLTRLRALFAQDGLKDALLRASSLLENTARAEVENLSHLQANLVKASVVLLIIEVIFIFAPAQLIVRSNIRQLRHQGDILRQSETKLQDANTRLQYLINHDALTGLPNRSSLMAYLKAMLSDHGSPELGMLFIDLDGFKSINDSVGYECGDAVLVQVAEILQSCVDDDNVVARVGGDEFVLITHEDVSVLERRVRASIAEPLEIKGRRLPINMSIGLLELLDTNQDPQTVMANLGLAIQAAKGLGGNRSQKFESDMHDEIGSLRRLQLELSDAITNGEIEPWFQPQIRLSDGKLHGVEVLARWRHPTRGLLTPDKFLPAAERSGQMVDMDHSIWRAAMAHAQNWQNAELWRPCISLNAAPDTISDPYLIERFLLELQNSGLDTDQVVVEVLETTLIGSKDDMAAINIDSLAECGISLELDDFGTGYASLSKLTQLPLSGIKLDRSLIAPLPDQSADSVVRAILALAAELGLHVVAEGVEEDAQAQHLNNRGCAFGQGYGYAPPMPAAEFEKWLGLNANRQMSAGDDEPPLAKRA